MLKITFLLILLLFNKTISFPFEATDPWINAEVYYLDNNFSIKNIDDFIWTNVIIAVHSWNYKYELIEKVDINETISINFNDFIAVYDTFDDISTPFDERKMKLGSTVPSYLINIDSDQGYNGFTLYTEGKIGDQSFYNPINNSEINYYYLIIVFLILISILLITFYMSKKVLYRKRGTN